jgi:hypothetical protein
MRRGRGEGAWVCWQSDGGLGRSCGPQPRAVGRRSGSQPRTYGPSVALIGKRRKSGRRGGLSTFCAEHAFFGLWAARPGAIAAARFGAGAADGPRGVIARSGWASQDWSGNGAPTPFRPATGPQPRSDQAIPHWTWPDTLLASGTGAECPRLRKPSAPTAASQPCAGAQGRSRRSRCVVRPSHGSRRRPAPDPRPYARRSAHRTPPAPGARRRRGRCPCCRPGTSAILPSRPRSITALPGTRRSLSSPRARRRYSRGRAGCPPSARRAVAGRSRSARAHPGT